MLTSQADPPYINRLLEAKKIENNKQKQNRELWERGRSCLPCYNCQIYTFNKNFKA